MKNKNCSKNENLEFKIFVFETDSKYLAVLKTINFFNSL